MEDFSLESHLEKRFRISEKDDQQQGLAD